MPVLSDRFLIDLLLCVLLGLFLLGLFCFFQRQSYYGRVWFYVCAGCIFTAIVFQVYVCMYVCMYRKRKGSISTDLYSLNSSSGSNGLFVLILVLIIHENKRMIHVLRNTDFSYFLLLLLCFQILSSVRSRTDFILCLCAAILHFVKSNVFRTLPSR